MKKIALTFLLATGFLGMDACTCEEYIPFWNITDLNQDYDFNAGAIHQEVCAQ